MNKQELKQLIKEVLLKEFSSDTKKKYPNMMKSKAAVKLYENETNYDIDASDPKTKAFIKRIKSGQLTYLKALHEISYENKTNIYEILSDSGIPFGNGEYEKYLEENGLKITSADIKNMNDEDASSLLCNIFYNGQGGLKKLISDELVKELINTHLKYSIDNEIVDLGEVKSLWNDRGPVMKKYLMSKFK